MVWRWAASSCSLLVYIYIIVIVHCKHYRVNMCYQNTHDMAICCSVLFAQICFCHLCWLSSCLLLKRPANRAECQKNPRSVPCVDIRCVLHMHYLFHFILFRRSLKWWHRIFFFLMPSFCGVWTDPVVTAVISYTFTYIWLGG